MSDYENLPTILSSEQVRKVLHISKRKCAWMLNNGYIKCRISKTKTRKYTVRLADLMAFIDDSTEHPEKYRTPYGEFSSVKGNTCSTEIVLCDFSNILPDDFADCLEKEWKDVPDVLTSREVANVTGYTRNSVGRWLQQGLLKSVQVQTGRIIAKEWLIEFYCNHGCTITRMSPQHIELMEKYFKSK